MKQIKLQFNSQLDNLLSKDMPLHFFITPILSNTSNHKRTQASILYRY